MKRLRILLGDQLNINHSWFHTFDSDTTYVLMEVRSETDYVTHHIQKVVGIFAAMRNFAHTLSKLKHQVIYIPLDAPNNQQDFTQNLIALIEEHHFEQIEYQLPDEYRLNNYFTQFQKQIQIPIIAVESEHFYTERDELKQLFPKGNYLMENFYRYMRKKHQLLMENGKPMGEKWNFDEENRKRIPNNHQITPPLLFDQQVESLVQLLEKMKVKTMGSIDAQHFNWPLSRKEAFLLLDYFIEHGLIHFGTLQDAMTTKSWLIYHSRISFALNIKLISPKEVVDKVIASWEKNQHCTINQVEGFIRQIIGWREYVRGIYWAEMPNFSQLNYFQHDRKLPDWFWNGNTKMNCLKYSIKQSLEQAYAHHIQRLMVIGNFSLLAGIHPNEVDQWYLGVYMDAFEWVEITNTRGMSQFADGGIVGSKPYVSSASYIDKMSDYCKNCYYLSKEKVGEKACPFNSLYWNFYDAHQTQLRSNHRMKMMYALWDKMNPSQKEAILIQADNYLNNLENL